MLEKEEKKKEISRRGVKMGRQEGSSLTHTLNRLLQPLELSKGVKRLLQERQHTIKKKDKKKRM